LYEAEWLSEGQGHHRRLRDDDEANGLIGDANTMRRGEGVMNTMSFDGGRIEDIRSLVPILVRQSYSECCGMLVYDKYVIARAHLTESIDIRYNGCIDWNGIYRRAFESVY
jgi:hypothetical protein